MRQDRGFTLIEMMIVVVIVAILASIAFPSYQEHVRKTRRADCTGAMLSLANALERYFTNNSTYAGATLGNNAGDIFPAQCPIDGDTAYYNLAIQNANATGYQLQATPVNAQAGDRCGTLTLNQLGQKGIANAAGGVTWQECW